MESETSAFQQWKLDSAERQQSIYIRFGDRKWDQIKKTEQEVLRSKLSLYVFNKNYSDLLETEEKNERLTLQNTINKLLELSGGDEHLFLGCVYVEALLKKTYDNSIIPILRTKKRYDDRIFFYEVHSSRVYKSWEDYEKNNKLPECWICYPEGGFYEAHPCRDDQDRQVRLNYRESPSCNKLLPAVDILSAVGGGVCTAVLAIPMFFPAFAVLELAAVIGLTGSGIYGTTRGVCSLIDRSTHNQSISLTDPQALMHWLNIVLSSGSVLTVGSATIIRNASLPLAVSNNSLRLASNILRYVSIGVNSVGIIAIIIDLIISLLSNKLQLKDLRKMVDLCLHIANIVISHTQAEQIIRVMADQPERMRNAFNMVKNTSIAVVKCIVSNAPWTTILEYLTGDVSMNILKNIGVRRVAETILFIKNRLRKCIRDEDNAVWALLDICRHCFPILTELIFEVNEALGKIQLWFNFTIRGKPIFKQPSGSFALQITDNVERVLDSAALEETGSKTRDEIAKSTVELVNNVAYEMMHCETPADYMKICEFVCDKVNARYHTECIVEQSEMNNSLTVKKKYEIFRKILKDFEKPANKREIVDSFQETQECLREVDQHLIFRKPVFQTEETSLYYFEAPTNFLEFNQFLIDAACELLETQNLFTVSRQFFLHPRETIFAILDGNKSLIFDYEIDSKRNRNVGIVILDDEKSN